MVSVKKDPKNQNILNALLNFTDFHYENLDKGKFSLSIFIDLKKAFDTIDHKILMEKF